MNVFAIFPKLLLVVIAFNVIAFSSGSFMELQDGQDPFRSVLFGIGMLSGDQRTLTLGDLIILVALGFLFIEIVKATQTDPSAQLNHAFSIGVLIICLIEFITLQGFGNSTFFIVMCMTFVDVVAGFTVTINSARRDVGVVSG